MNLEKTTVEATRAAGQFISRNAFNIGTVDWKERDDPVTNLDREAEKLFREKMNRHGTFNYLGEEYGTEDKGSDITFIIDPIDGTKSFLRREFYTSFSLGIHQGGNPLQGGQLIGGIVYDFMRDIMYVGFEDNLYIQFRGEKQPFDQGPNPFSKIRVSVTGNQTLWDELERQGLSVCQKHGSIALGLAELAAGNYDAQVSAEIGKGNIWDVAGGYYLLKATNCEVFDYHGKPFNYQEGSNGVLAFRPGILKKFPFEPKEIQQLGRYKICDSANALPKQTQIGNTKQLPVMDEAENRGSWNDNPAYTCTTYWSGD